MRGILKPSSNEIRANELFLNAVERDDVTLVGSLLRNNDNASLVLGQKIMNKAFEFSVYNGSKVMMAEILSIRKNKNSLLPDQFTIDKMYSDCAASGTDPDVILLLQNYASSEAYCAQQRKNVQMRNDRRYMVHTHYVVSFLEPEKLKEIDKRSSQHHKKLQSSNRANVFTAILSDQRWINGVFMDSVDSHFKLVVLRLLTVKANEEQLRPDQTTINEAFVRTISRGYLSMAAMLSEPSQTVENGEVVVRRGVDQAGFDQAFTLASDADCEDTMEWLLSGSQGMTPSRDVIDEVYLTRSRRPVVDMNMRFRGFAAIRNMGRTMERRRKEREHELRITAVITSRASERVVALIARERRIAAQRQALFNRMQNNGYTDIHSYSASRVGDANEDVELRQPPMEGIGDEVDNQDGMQDDVEDEDVAVDDDEVVAARQPLHRPTPKKNLQDAVIDCIERRVGGVALSLEHVTARMSRLIEEALPSEAEQTRAMRIVADGMNDRNARILGLTVNFLSGEQFPPSALQVWIQGFLVESIEVNSCNPGAMERIITGLRGVDDPELNQIFTLAEGPNLARIFLMGTFNIYFTDGDEASKTKAKRNAQNLAHELVSRGVTPQSTEEEANAALTAYAMEAITAYGVQGFEDQVRNVVETVVDMYEEYLLPIVTEICSSSSSSTAVVSTFTDM